MAGPVLAEAGANWAMTARIAAYEKSSHRRHRRLCLHRHPHRRPHRRCHPLHLLRLRRHLHRRRRRSPLRAPTAPKKTVARSR
eukprot:scaffold49641_cov41-Phaeocystis_antarctica.AAC.1